MDDGPRRGSLKWTGVILSMLLFVLLVVSTELGPGYRWFSSVHVAWHVIFQGGCLDVGKEPRNPFHLEGWGRWSGDGLTARLPKLENDPARGVWVFWFPLWIPFVIVAVPTVVLWRRERSQDRMPSDAEDVQRG
jgi:hypothetical protein